MAGCHEMKFGQVYTCPSCGIELEIVRECTECSDDKACCADPCGFECCGVPLTLKA